MKAARLETGGDANRALADLLAGALESGAADLVLAPAAQSSGGAALALFADPEVARAEMLAFSPVMGVQAARMLSRITFDDTARRVVAVLKPCEARAAVELIKLNQIKPENMVAITLDCPSTCELKAFAANKADAREESGKLVAAMQEGRTDQLDEGSDALAAPLRASCRTCTGFSAEWGDVRVEAFGLKVGEAMRLSLTDVGAGFVGEAGLEVADQEAGGSNGSSRNAVLDRLREARAKARDEMFEAFSAMAGSVEGFRDEFSACIRCHNCMEACPVCYCKLCIFKSPTFDHASERYGGWAVKKGAQKMPSDTTLFHITRLNHMSSSCIGCGLCDTACPMGLPVSQLFRSTAARVQSMLDYEAGRSLDEPIPLTVFREDELQTETGAED